MGTVTSERATRAAAAPPANRLTAGRRRIGVPWVLGGLLVTVGCALAFGVLAQGLADRRPILVLARPVERGTVLGDADLAVAQISADPGVQVVAADDRARLLGRTLLTAMPQGSVITPDLVAPGAVDIGPGSRTVGLALEPGAYPTASLAPGDIVSVVETTAGGAILDDAGAVLDVQPAMEGTSTLLVSVVVDVETAARIAAAAAQDQIRLVLHGAGR